MVQFEHPEWLYLLLLLPAVVVGFAGLQRWRKRAIRRIGDEMLIHKLFNGYSIRREWMRFALWSSGLAFLLLALLNPQWGHRFTTVAMNRSDIVIAFDISQSLWCQDVQPNRLEKARSFALDALKALRGHRVGLIFFAGQANLEVPLTDDYELLAEIIKIAGPDMASRQGTSIGAAIRLAGELLGTDGATTKGMLLISDGESHDSDALASAREAYGSGVVIWTAGVGTTAGDVIPVEVFGNQDFKRDESGQPVRTVLREDLLRKIAAAAGGKYWNLGHLTEAGPLLTREVAGLDSRRSSQRVYDTSASRFQYPLALGAFLILIDWCWPLIARKTAVDKS